MPSKIAPIPPIQGTTDVKSLEKAFNLTITAMNNRLQELATPAQGSGSADDAPAIRAIGGALNDLPIGRGSYLEITMKGNLTLTGMAGGTDERLFILKVTGTGTLTLAHQSTSSTEGNRLWMRDLANSTLNAASNGAALFMYVQRLRSWHLVIGVV